MKPIRLRTEYLEQPIGLGITKPRFYWNCEGGVTQSAYRIIAKNGDTILWDSGKVISSAMSHIRYEGQPLKSRDRVDWSVQLWDENGASDEAVTSWFELGLLETSDWKARWISGAYKPKKNRRYPVDCFKKEFALKGAVRKARLYITACGLYRAMINGQRAGTFYLAPGCTDYRCRLYYQTYDITELLASQNRLEIELADGWYRGAVGAWGITNLFGRQTKLLCQIEVFYQDGHNETIISDRTFCWSNDGPRRFADLKDGEIYEADRKPGYRGFARETSGKLVPQASNNVPVLTQEVFHAALITTPSGKTVLNFGQNIAGFIAFKIQGKRGQKIRLLMGETLDKYGEFTQENFQLMRPGREVGKIAELFMISHKSRRLSKKLVPTPKQEIIFTCSGNDDQYQTEFAVFGFRYALIEADFPVRPGDFCAIAVYSGMETAGTFNCSNPKIEKLFQNTMWGMKGNFLDVPTDCPTRERIGWTGDAQVFFDTSAYLMDTTSFFRKWLADLCDSQLKDGKFPGGAPYIGLEVQYNFCGGSVGWSDAIVLIPYRYWKRYGDLDLVKDCYPMMRKYAMYMIGNAGYKDKSKNKTNPYYRYVYEKGWHFGEWLEPEGVGEAFTPDASATRIVHTEECTAYLHYTMCHMVELAQATGHGEDVAQFQEYADGAAKAYEFMFLQTVPDTDRQAKLIRPLAFGIAEGGKKTEIARRLFRAVENRQYRVGTGFLSTPFVLSMLTQEGRADLAYKMLENEQAPGWLYEVNANATTIWEDWEGKVSLNHYSPGAVCSWLFDTVCGIRVAGENHFRIAPVPGGSLTFAEAAYTSLYGTVRSRWEKKANGFCLALDIPANTSAEIHLPGGKTCALTAGTYRFEWQSGAV